MTLIKLTQEKRLSKLPSPIYAITGGIATGKSTVSKKLRELGHPLLCADELIKKIYSEKKTIAFFLANFPQVFEKNLIDFKKLRELFFNDQKAQASIEGFLYPRLEALITEEFHALGSPSYLFYDVPLLFEKKMDVFVDYKILVYAPREMQIERMMKRNGFSRETAILVLDHQWDIEKKLGLSDFVISNEKSPDEILPQIQILLKKIL